MHVHEDETEEETKGEHEGKMNTMGAHHIVVLQGLQDQRYLPIN